MKHMNDYDIMNARARFGRGTTPNRLALAIMIERLANWADVHSDGWAYWTKPRQSAQRAIGLVESRTYRENDQQEREDITQAELDAAVRPVKAFLTRMARETNRHGNPLVSPAERELILRSTQPLFVVI